MTTPFVTRIVCAVLILNWAVPQILANSDVTMTDEPTLAKLHNIVVRLDMIPFCTYPNQASELFESNTRRDVEAKLKKAGFAILTPYDAGDSTPELTFSVDSACDARHPALVALHTRLTLRDRVALHNRRIGHLEDDVELWAWWDTEGETSIVERDDVSSAIDEWITEALEGFVNNVSDAAVASRKAAGQK